VAVRVIHWSDVGDGRVQVHARTESGNELDAVVGRDLLGTATLASILDVRGRSVDDAAAALEARKGRTDQE